MLLTVIVLVLILILILIYWFWRYKQETQTKFFQAVFVFDDEIELPLLHEKLNTLVVVINCRKLRVSKLPS